MPDSAADWRASEVRALRHDLALALRAAAHHGLDEGICNHFSVELPDQSGRFLINPRGRACVLHTHMPHATALTLTTQRALDTRLSQNAMRFHGRVAIDSHYHGLALDAAEGERIAALLTERDILFLGNHGVIVCGERLAYAYDDLYYLERACRLEVHARQTGHPLAPVAPELAARVQQQSAAERLQSLLLFEALGRALPEPPPGRVADATGHPHAR